MTDSTAKLQLAFPDEVFSAIMDELLHSSCVEAHDFLLPQNLMSPIQVDGRVDQQELLSPPGQVDEHDNFEDLFQSLGMNNNPLYSPSLNGDVAEELILLQRDTLEDGWAIFDNEQTGQNSEADENSDRTDISIPRQADGSENGILYQMCPGLFHSLVGAMLIAQQPKANKRSRYACDGKRFLPDSRHHPMAIHLPNLRNTRLEANQVLGVVLTMVTDTNNLQNQSYLHANDIVYDVNTTERIGHGCVFIPLEKSAIETSIQKFPRLSILYKKYEDYSLHLVPFHPSTMFGPTEIYNIPGQPKMGKVQQVKRFRQEYNLLTYKLVFHLALKQDNIICISDSTCETDVIDEHVGRPQLQQQPASVSSTVLSEEENSEDTTTERAPKRFRTSSPPLTGLPVHYASNETEESEE